MKTVLSIAGSDSSGGAGIQADLKTMAMNGVYGMSAVTALTAQNTTGVKAIFQVSPEFLRQQIDAVFEDIRPNAVKIGMVPSARLLSVIVERLKHYDASRIVVDPVMVSTSGFMLMQEEVIPVLERELFPMAALVTPNLPEAEVLTGMAMKNPKDMEEAARKMGETYCCAVLLKGGHASGNANDLLYDHGRYHWFTGRHIRTFNTHGTGCTLSSAIAANLAKGFALEEAIKRAKDYLAGALAAMLNLGAGSGPVDHIFPYEGRFKEEAKEIIGRKGREKI